jgi:hypothetical protein
MGPGIMHIPKVHDFDVGVIRFGLVERLVNLFIIPDPFPEIFGCFLWVLASDSVSF